MNLQQSTTFKPLMQKLILFAHIALRTGYHQIADIIGAATRQGYDMVYMVSILTRTQLFTTVVAFTLLAVILPLNIFNGMASWCFLFQRHPISRIRAYQLSISVIMLSTICLAFLFMQFVVRFSLFCLTSSASGTQTRALTSKVFSSGGERLTTWAGTGTHWLLRLCCSLFRKPFNVGLPALLAYMRNTIFGMIVREKVLKRDEFFLLALRATPISYYARVKLINLSADPLYKFLSGIFTCFTSSGELIFSPFISTKVFKGSGMPLVSFRARASRAAFQRGIFRGYNIKHSYHPSYQGGSLGVISAGNTCNSAIFAPNYSINPPVAQVCEVGLW